MIRLWINLMQHTHMQPGGGGEGGGGGRLDGNMCALDSSGGEDSGLGACEVSLCWGRPLAS